MKSSLNKRIAIGVLLGITAWIFLNVNKELFPSSHWIFYLCDLAGGIFINLLKMVLMPLIFLSITLGISNLKAQPNMHRIWKYTLIYFLVTTSLASFLGLLIVNIFKPGHGVQLEMFKETSAQLNVQNITLPQFIQSFFSELFMNPFRAMADGKIIPVIVFAVFLGIGLISGGNKSQTVQKVFNELFDIIMRIVGWIMEIAPIGIMALLLKLTATQDVNLLFATGGFISVVAGGTLFHGIVTLPLVLYLITRMTPVTFFSGMKESLLTAFSTSSSSATLPVTMQCVENNLRVEKEIYGFILPLGATVNMDGTALYEAIAAIFVANVLGIDLNLLQQIIVFLMAILASIGAPGIPSAGMVTMLMVLQSVGLPTEAIVLLIPIDRFLDTIRTVVNVQGDAIGCVIVKHLLNKKPA